MVTTIFRQIVKGKMTDGMPNIANCGTWLNQNYPNRNPEHQISSTYVAYSQDNNEYVAIVYCKNQEIIASLIRDFKLQTINSNSDADALTTGWRRGGNSKFEELTSTSTTTKKIDNSTIEKTTECCAGCRNNPDGLAPPTVERKQIAPPQPHAKLKEVRIEESRGEIAFTIVNDDDTKVSYVLQETEKHTFTEKSMSAARELLGNWGNRIGTIADLYVRERRTVDSFLYELIALGRFTSELPAEAKFLLEPHDPESLLHDRVMAQLLFEYTISGCDIVPKLAKNEKSNDFDACGIKCDVKTIRVEGNYEKHPSHGVRLTSTSASRLRNNIQQSISDKTEQVENGMIFLAPLSPVLNAIMRTYFSSKLSILPPPPKPNTVILVLSSNFVFCDYYVAMDRGLAISTLNRMLSEIESFGIPLAMISIRNGLTIQLTTGSEIGSSISRIDRLI